MDSNPELLILHLFHEFGNEVLMFPAMVTKVIKYVLHVPILMG